MDCAELRSIRLTSAERATLARAATLLERLRELRQFDDDDLGVDIALSGYTLRELLEDATVPA
jgi:hypothetical protein